MTTLAQIELLARALYDVATAKQIQSLVRYELVEHAWSELATAILAQLGPLDPLGPWRCGNALPKAV